MNTRNMTLIKGDIKTEDRN